MRDFYILKSGKLKKKGDTVYFIFKENGKLTKKSLPVNLIDSIFIFGECSFNTKFLNFIAKNLISVHFFNYYGYYTGSFSPKRTNTSGFLIVNQVKNYLNEKDRVYIAKEIVRGAIHNSIKNLIYYNKQMKILTEEIRKMKILLAKLEECKNVKELMAIEGNAKFIYYQSFEKFLGKSYKLEKRIKKPPDNAINALISFTNSLLYVTCLNQIYKTPLEPSISFLHEPRERRYSLSLDIAEVFKPIIVDKTIFKLINNKMINESHFIKELNYCSLNEKGRRVVIEEYENRLSQTIYHKKMKRHVSYRNIIKLECYKLVKHLVGDEIYKSFKMLW